MNELTGPHAGARLHAAGAPLERAASAMVLLHGRGATAEDILSLGTALRRDDLALIAPQAVGYAWYPHRFIVPVAMNEPHLSSALALVGACLERLAAAGIPRERTLLAGFSQGACLALEFAARNPARYGGVVALSGGLIGDPAAPRTYEGDLAGTPVFLGCSDTDFHIPQEIVDESAEIMRGLGGAVDKRIYPGMGHTVNDDELDAMRALVDRLPA